MFHWHVLFYCKSVLHIYRACLSKSLKSSLADPKQQGIINDNKLGLKYNKLDKAICTERGLSEVKL